MRTGLALQFAKQDRERVPAFLQAGFLQAAELVEAGNQQSERTGNADDRVEHFAGRGECVTGKGQRREHRRGGEPDAEVTGDQHQRMDDRLALDPSRVGDFAIGADHRRGRRQHHRDRHQEPHQNERAGLQADTCRPSGAGDRQRAKNRSRKSGNGSRGRLRRISVAGGADARNPPFGAADCHRGKQQPGEQDTRADNDVHRHARTARDVRHGAAGAVEMAEVVLLAGHDIRMGRIAALIKRHDLTYMLIDWQVWWAASHCKPEADLGASGNCADTGCRHGAGRADRGARFRRCRFPGDARRARGRCPRWPHDGPDESCLEGARAAGRARRHQAQGRALEGDAHRRRDQPADPQPRRHLPRQRDRRGPVRAEPAQQRPQSGTRQQPLPRMPASNGDGRWWRAGISMPNMPVPSWPTAARWTHRLAVAADGRAVAGAPGGRHLDLGPLLPAGSACAQFPSQPRPCLHLDRIPHRDRSVHAGSAARQSLEPGLGGEAGDRDGTRRIGRCDAFAAGRAADAVDAGPGDGRAGPADLSAFGGDAAAFRARPRGACRRSRPCVSADRRTRPQSRHQGYRRSRWNC